MRAIFNYLLGFNYRSAQDVLTDLGAESEAKSRKRSNEKYIFEDELGKAGLIEDGERRRYLSISRFVPIIAALFCALIGFFAGKQAASPVFGGVIGLALGFLISKQMLRAKQARYVRDIEFALPLIMERLVMAVQAGLDILPALNTVVKSADPRHIDPVTRLLGIVFQMSEAGVGFEQSLRHVAGKIECSALRHTFVHLALAQKEGGELIMPLRELSDSTQLYFQESVEEEIAKMPVKATLPLLLTFTGLVICFITTPILQVTTMLQKATPGQIQGVQHGE